MIKNVFLSLVSLFFIFSCASKPYDYRPIRKNKPTAAGTKSPQKPTEDAEAPKAVVTAEAPVKKPEPVVPSQPLPELDYFQVLKNPATTKKQALELIEKTLNEKELERALDDEQLVTYHPQILWQLGTLAQKKHDTFAALQHFRSISNKFSSHPLASPAAATASLLQSSQDVNAKTIGAILPLTGKNANVGEHALNAIRMGLGIGKSDSKFRLAVYDTQSSADQVAAGVDKLLRDDKVIALIGGLSSKEATAIAQRADLFSVPFIGLSQKSGLTNIGDYVFRNSLTPEMQVDELVQYAFEKLGAHRFAVLYPNDSYGVEFANIYWDHVLVRGGQITAAQSFDPKENDFTDVIRKLVGTYYPEARPDEYRERLKEIKLAKREKAEKNKNKSKKSREHDAEENVLSPIIDFDVLFIPDSGKTLGQVMAFMKVNDVPGLTYLGTNIWNTPDLVKRASIQSSGVFFVDALDLNDVSLRESPFFKDYVAAFNEEPTLIEMQSYESAKILYNVISEGLSTRSSVASRLSSLGRSQGVTGELRMSNQRELMRPVHVFSLDHGLIQKVE